MGSGRINYGALLNMDSQQTIVIKNRRSRELYRWRIDKLEAKEKLQEFQQEMDKNTVRFSELLESIGATKTIWKAPPPLISRLQQQAPGGPMPTKMGPDPLCTPIIGFGVGGQNQVTGLRRQLRSRPRHRPPEPSSERNTTIPPLSLIHI